MLFRGLIPFLFILRIATTSPTSSEPGGQIGSWEEEITSRGDLTRRANEIDIDVDPSDEDFFPSGQPFFEYESDLHDSTTRLSRLSKRATGRVIHQTKGMSLVEELAFCSQPEGSDIFDVTSFAFQDYAGSGITVYVHDTGINLAHPVFNGHGPPGVQLGTYEWLYPKMTDALRAKYSEADLKPQGDSGGHGTCVADKIVGRAFGVAKGANLKVVPFVNITDDNLMIAGLKAIVDDIRTQRGSLSKRGSHPDGYFPVINLSYEIGSVVTEGQETIDRFRTVFKALVDLDAIIVTSALNLLFPGRSPEDQYPVLFADEDALKNNIIVVGAVDINGERTQLGHKSRLIKVSAPSRNFLRGGTRCAAGTGNGYVQQEGSSFAAPIVAGVAAYLLSVDPTLRTPGSAAPKVIKRIVDLSYPRQPGYPNAVWNGEMGRVVQC